MSVRKAVYDLLNNTSTKAYPVVAPQELTDPYMTFFLRRSPVRSQDGISVEEVDLTLNIYANSFSSCVTLADSMYTALENASGSLDSGNETLHVCNWVLETDDYIESLDKILITQEYNLKFI